MKTLLTILCFCTLTCALAQNRLPITFDDEANYKLENGASISDINGNKAVKFTDVSQQIRISTVSNLSQLNFEFWSNKEGNANIKFYYLVDNKLQLIETKSITLYSIPTNDNLKYDLLGTYDLIIQYEKSDVQELYLDNVVYYPMNSDKISVLKTTEILESILTANKRSEYESSIVKAEEISKDNFVELHVLYNKYNALNNITKTALFIDSRAAMINPINYESFRNTLDTLKKSCDANSKLLVTNIEKKLQSLKAKSTITTSAIGKVITIGGNLLNLASIGQFSSLFNSLKTITATLFNKDLIESKNLDVSSMVIHKENNPKKELIGIKQAKLFNDTEVKNAINQGIRLQSFFNTFLDEIENQQSEYLALMDNFKQLSGSIEIRSDSILLLLKSQYKYFNIPFNYDTVMNVSKASDINKRPSIIRANEIITNFFADKRKLNNENKNVLTELQSMNITININREKYIQSSSRLYESFLLFAINFNKENPYNPSTKMYSEFENLRIESIKNYTSLIESLETTLSKPASFDYYYPYLQKVKNISTTNI